MVIRGTHASNHDFPICLGIDFPASVSATKRHGNGSEFAASVALLGVWPVGGWDRSVLLLSLDPPLAERLNQTI